MIKRFLALFLLLVTLALCFVSCVDGGEVTPDGSELPDVSENPDASGAPDVTDAPAGSDAPETEVPAVEPAEMVISVDGVTNYEVIYANKATAVIKEQANRIGDALKALGANVTVKSEWAKELMDTSADCEIRVGVSARPESIEVADSIAYDDYAIKFVRNKVVVVAHTTDRMEEAVAKLCESITLKTEDGKNKVCVVGERHFVGDKIYLFTKDNPLSDYRIVYADNTTSKENAELLTSTIKSVYGVDLKMVTDNEAAQPKEIVIGNTNRAISQRYIDENDKYGYVIKVASKQVLIGGIVDYVSNYAVRDFISSYISRDLGNAPSLTANCDVKDTISKFANDPALAEGADIRVFSFNVLFDNTHKNPTIAERSICLDALLNHFQPDVIGLQEFNERWHAAFAEMDSGYRIVDADVGLNYPNNSCIAYNPKKVRLSRHGYQIYSKGDRAHLRLASWAKFEDLDSGKEFIVVNTHWDIVAEYQMIHAVEKAELVLELQKKYGCPVITTGDYNRNETTAEYKKYVEISGLKDSKYTALTKGNVHTTSGHGFSQPAKMVNVNVLESIDHIFGDDRVEFRYFTVLTDQLTRDSSDHCPIFADIKLK